MHAWKNNALVSSNINEVIGVVLNFLIFFLRKYFALTKSTKKQQKAQKAQKEHKAQKAQKTQKAPKSTRKHKKHKKHKHKDANNRINIKNALKNI